jgi:Tol biopolymer transport system component
MAQPFNPQTATLSGEPVLIAEPLQIGPSFSSSENGVLIFRRSRGTRSQLTWFDREGRQLGTVGDAGMVTYPKIAPDQKSAAFTQLDGRSSDIWLFDGERGNVSRFTSGSDSSLAQVWSPDGSRIAYLAIKPSESLLIARAAGGVGNETVLYRSTTVTYYPQCWSRDGRWLLLGDIAGSFYLLSMGPEASGSQRKPIPLPENFSDGRHPSLSPDGRWLLYSSTQTGRREVFLESMPEQMGGPATGVKKQVSIAGGGQGTWRADGKELFYLAGDDRMMSVNVDSSGPSLKLGLPKPLFQTRLEFESFLGRQYDVSADGKRFLLAQPLDESASVPITVIVNWPMLLKKGVGVR